jgi:type 1 glutamine amidotransferase
VGGCSLAGALGLKPKRDDSVAPALPAELGRDARVTLLLFSKTAGFRHQDAIPAAEATVREIARRRGWEIFSTENAAVFGAEQLARFDVVFGNNNSGDCWTDAQKAAFRSWIERGGGFVGVHGAGGTRYEYWPWYQDVLLGARFIGHPIRPQFQQASLRVENRNHPATRHLVKTWQREDEWYSFEINPRERGVHVLATLDESTYSPKALWNDLSMGEDHPIIWSHCVDQGRSFYSALGHKGSYYEEPEYVEMIEGAIEWAAGSGECLHPIAASESP